MERLSGDELRGRNATMVWDGLGTIQLTYDGAWIKQKSTLTHMVHKRLGGRTVPVEALAGVELVMPGGAEDPTIRLVLREHADPLLAVAGGQLDELMDPYRLDFGADQWLLADYYAQEIRTSIALHQAPAGPSDRWLLEPPAAPDVLKCHNCKLWLEGDTLVIDYGFANYPEKRVYGDPYRLPLAEIKTVEWTASKGITSGYLRITSVRTPADRGPERTDPETIPTKPIGGELDALFFGAKLRWLINR